MKKVIFFWAMAIGFSLAGQNPSRADDVKIYCTDEAPTNYMADGKLTGTTTEIVEAMIKSMGLPTTIELLPGARAAEYVEKGPNVAVFTYAKTPEREKAGYHFVGPMTTRSNTLWKKKGSPISVKSLDDVKSQNFTVGGSLGDFRTKLLQDAGVSVETAAAADLNLKKLLVDRIPLMVSSDFAMPPVVKQVGVSMSDVEPAYVITQSTSYLMFSKDTDQATIEKWQNAFVALQKTDFFTKLIEKYSPIVGSPLKFAPDKGLYIP